MNKDFSQQIRDSLTAEAVSAHYGFKLPVKSGGNIRSPLGLTDDKTPSFNVKSDGKLWNCFSSQMGGDWLRFISIKEGLDETRDFPEILKIAAKICNISEEEVNKNITTVQDPIKEAWKKFKENRNKYGLEARNALLERKGIDIYGKGLNKIEWGVSMYENAWHITIPMKDEKGKIIGFQRANKRIVKDTKLGLFYEKINKKKPIFFVEGFSDYLSMYQMGYENILAIASATVKTKMVLDFLEGALKVHMFLDSDVVKDKDGQTSGSAVGTKKALDIKDKFGPRIKCYFVSVDEKLDINDLLLRGKNIDRYLEKKMGYTLRQVKNLIPGNAEIDNAYISDEFLLQYDIAYIGKTWWAYTEPIWRRTTEEKVFGKIQKFIEDDMDISHTADKIRKVLFYIKINCSYNSEKLLKTIQGDRALPKNLVFLQNGKHDLETGNIVRYSPNDYAISTINISGTTRRVGCPMFMEFLNDIFKGDEDIEDRIKFIQEWIGNILYPHLTHQKCLFIIGSGANGKGTLLNVIEDIVGKGNFVNLEISRLDNDKFATSQLLGAHVNIISDAERSANLSSPTLKKLVGGDSVSMERKYEQGTSFKPFAKVIFASNHDPVARDVGNWLTRRLHMIKFNNKFASMGESGDLDLGDKLKTEREQITWWAMEGLKRLLKDGFTLPESVKKTTNDFVESADYLNGYIKAKLMRKFHDFQKTVLISEAYDDFRSYCLDDLSITRKYIYSKPYFLKRLGKTDIFDIDEMHLRIRNKQ